MERSLIKQVNVKNMGARLNTRKVKPVYFPNFFGVKAKTSLKWETLTGEKGAPVIADVISFDASAPQKSREVIGKLSGDIPKVSIKRGMNESDYNEYEQLNKDVQGDAQLKSVLDLAFKDQDFVYNGVRGRYEWWCMQLMSDGGYILNTTNNNGIITEEFVGCGIPKSNRKISSADWSSVATADGLQDIEDAVGDASKEGVVVKYAILRKSDFIKLKKQKSTYDKLKSWSNTTGKLAVTKKLINEYMKENELPEIVTVDPSVRIEDSAHKRTTINPWTENRVCLVPDLMVGDIQHGPIAAEKSAEIKKIATCVKKDFVFIQKWSELEPFKEWTKAEANAIPVMNDPDTIFLLKTDGKEWEADKEVTDDVTA